MSDAADLKPLLEQLLAIVQGQAERIAGIETSVSDIRNRLEKLERIADRAELKGRLDEQGRIVAALVSTPVAAAE